MIPPKKTFTNSRSVGIHSKFKASLCYQECDPVSKKKEGRIGEFPRGLTEDSGLISNSSMELLTATCTSGSR